MSSQEPATAISDHKFTDEESGLSEKGHPDFACTKKEEPVQFFFVMYTDLDNSGSRLEKS